MTQTSGSARVLVVDDDPHVTSLLERLMRKEGHVVDVAGDGAACLEAVAAHPPDLILLDVVLPQLDGFSVCRRLKRDPATRLTPIILITGVDDPDAKVQGLDAGADDFLAKPIDIRELLARSRALIRLKRYTDDLDSAASIVMTLAVMIEARDGLTEGHCHRMANYAAALGRRIGLSEEDLQALHRGGFLHDIGMLAIPDGVLRKPGALEPEEFELVKSHTVVGDSLCANLRSLQSVRPIVRYHHERLDGSGYPDGLRGDAVPLVAQILGIVDVYDAVTTQRPYQRAHSIEQALTVLRSQVERGWRRSDLVEAFADLVESGKLDTFRSGGDGSQDITYDLNAHAM
jgi:putative two-component system response regulator